MSEGFDIIKPEVVFFKLFIFISLTSFIITSILFGISLKGLFLIFMTSLSMSLFYAINSKYESYLVTDKKNIERYLDNNYKVKSKNIEESIYELNKVFNFNILLFKKDNEYYIYCPRFLKKKIMNNN